MKNPSLRLALTTACFAFAGLASAQETAQPAPAAEPAAAAVPAPAAETAPAAEAAPAVAAAPVANLPIDCIEVELFKVAEEEKVEGQTDRAAAIPARNLELIRDFVVKHLPAEAKGIAAVSAGSNACPNPASAATLRGDILDFRKGNMALRYFVGFGAGSQKVRVRLSVDRKNDGSRLVQTEVADTKWAGAFGGTNTKGLDDFAEKAAEAAAVALKKR